MTIRLFYEDSRVSEFTATILETVAGKKHTVAVLDRTAFYPTSGGQPHDTGRLGTVRVVNVEEDESGRILHHLDAPVPLGPTTGSVDWTRRFDHMQQHTGQHILSQAFVQTAKAPTLSFHMGAETSTIDLELASPDDAAMREAEGLASAIVFEDRPVSVLDASPEDLPGLGLRKDTRREGTIRVIDVEGFDRSPCGGTHVRRTGEIGMIAILGHERYKGGTRVEFVCGGRALRTLGRDHTTLRELSRLYSAHPHELPQLTERFFTARAELLRENARLREQLLEHEAGEILPDASMIGSVRVVKKSFSDRGLDSVRVLAQKLVQQGGTVAILGLVAETCQIVLARSSDVPGDCGAAVHRVSAVRGGRGGGRPEAAQAGGIPASELQAWMNDLAIRITSEE